MISTTTFTNQKQRSTMNYNNKTTDNDTNTASTESTSSHEDVFHAFLDKRAAFQLRSTSEISMNLHDLLQDIQDDRDETEKTDFDSSCSLSLEDVEANSAIGSALKTENFPSSSSLGSMLFSENFPSPDWGSFKKRLTRKTSTSSCTSKSETTPNPERRKKVVRFQRFDTVFSSFRN